MTGLQVTDFELAVLIGLVLAVVTGLALVARRSQPDPAPALAVAPAVAAPGDTADLAVLQADVARMKGRLAEVEHGINQVRTMLNVLATKDAVHAVELQVAEMRGDLRLNSVSTAATAAAAKRIEDWIMRLDQREAGK